MKSFVVAQFSKIAGRTCVVAAMSVCLFATPHAFGAPQPGPCTANPESRQLDFWVGDWTISSAGSSPSATSKVSLSLDSCVITESWDSGRGHRGENVFAYSSGDQGWRGLFVDNDGRAHAFVDGKVSGGTAEFFGPSRGPNGEEVLNRIRVVRLSPDKVEQTWDKSTDKGASWTPVFRLEYSRKKS
jgi:hypothetical protein